MACQYSYCSTTPLVEISLFATFLLAYLCLCRIQKASKEFKLRFGVHNQYTAGLWLDFSRKKCHTMYNVVHALNVIVLLQKVSIIPSKLIHLFPNTKIKINQANALHSKQ